MDIRHLTDNDLSDAAALYLRAYGVDWNVAAAVTYMVKFLHFEPTSCFVVEDDGALRGVLIAYTYNKDGKLVLFLQDLFVDPDTRHKGYGRALIEALRNSFSEKTRIKVRPLVKADTGVLNFYDSLGFEREQVYTFVDDDELFK